MTLELPERPEGLPPPGPALARPWRAALAIPIAVVAVLAGALVYAVASAVRSALVTPPLHADGLVGVALHGTPPVLTLSSTLAQDVTLVVATVLAAAGAMRHRLRPRDLGLRGTRWLPAGGLVVAAYGAFLVLSAVWTSALGIRDRENVAIELGTRDSVGALVAAAVLVCVVAPICEELFFRGYLFAALRGRGLVPAAAITGVAFGFAHVLSAPIGFLVPLGALGVLLCLLYERTRSLYPCMALHALNNAVAFGAGDGRAWLVPACLAAAAATVAAGARGLRRLA